MNVSGLLNGGVERRASHLLVVLGNRGWCGRGIRHGAHAADEPGCCATRIAHGRRDTTLCCGVERAVVDEHGVARGSRVRMNFKRDSEVRGRPRATHRGTIDDPSS